MIDSSMLPDFIIEAQEHLEDLEGSLLRLEQKHDRDVLDDIFRAMHTIKGAAQFVGIDRVAELSHKLENLLDLIRKEEQPLNEEMVELLIAGKDRISLLVEELEQSQVEKTEVIDLLAHIKALVEGAPEDDVAAALSDEDDTTLEDVALAFSADELGERAVSEDTAADTVTSQTSSLSKDTDEEEYDDELYGIFLQQLKENMPFLYSQTSQLASSTTVEKQDVLNRCTDAIKSLKSSANYMGYEYLTKHYSDWQNKISSALVQLSQDSETDVSFMQGYIEEIAATYPEAMEGNLLEGQDNGDAGTGNVAEDADEGDDMVAAIHALFDDDTPFQDDEEQSPAEDTVAVTDGELTSTLDTLFDESDDDDASPLSDEEQAEPEVAAVTTSATETEGLEDETLGEIHDQELVDIFKKQLNKTIPFLYQQIQDLDTSDKSHNILDRCTVTLKSLASSSNYMGYTKLTTHYTVWLEAIESAVDQLSAGGDPDLSFMRTSIDEVIRVYPSANGVDAPEESAGTVEQDHEETIAESSAPETRVADNQDEFENVTDTIGSLLSEPPVAAETVQPSETIAAVSDDSVAAEPAVAEFETVGSKEDALFDQLSVALDVSLDQDINVSEKPMHSVIEEMIESSDGNGNGKSDEEKQEATVQDAEEAEPSVTTAAVDDGLDAIDTDHPVEVNAEEQEKEQPEPVDYQTAEAQLQAELREAKRQAAQEKVPEAKIKKSMRVDSDKIDYLMNQVGELVVSRAYFAQLFNEMKGLQQSLQEKHGLTKRELQPINEFAFRLGEAGGHLGRVSNELQEGVMKVRMLPIAQLFKRYPRLVRDLIHKTDKLVQLETRGEETELDKMVIEEISDPLIHVIRNSVDHGIETMAERKKAGKPESGTITLEAYHESDHIVVEITDDGRGIDVNKIKAKALAMGLYSRDELSRMSQLELTHIIMHPGFSTADKTTETSGRGVGMDVVRKNIEKLNGSVEISTEVGNGTKIRIKIPLTMAIIQALMVRVGTEKFTIPLTTVEETLRIFRDEISEIEGIDVIHLRDTTMPIFKLTNIFGVEKAAEHAEKFFVVVVSTGMQELGLVVDELLGQEEVVIKPLADYLRLESGFGGATILGDGGISLILDIPELMKITTEKQVRKQKEMTSKRGHFIETSAHDDQETIVH